MSELSNLPALRCLGGLADVRPAIVVDTREQTPLVFTRLPSRTGTLQSGDYSFAGAEDHFAVERKSIADLVACCAGDNRDRFFRELHRLRGFRFKRLLVVGTVGEIERGEYRSQVKPAAVLATLSAIEARFDVRVVFVPSPVEGARKVESWAYWYARELVGAVNNVACAHGVTGRVKKLYPAPTKPVHPQAN
jgi:DNA excision repair protein ERCC-4